MTPSPKPEGRRERANAKALGELGITDAAHVRYLLDRMPCGIETVGEAWKDKTLVQVNAPRALIVHAWQSVLQAFRTIEKERVK